jgi:hypothetical protein
MDIFAHDSWPPGWLKSQPKSFFAPLAGCPGSFQFCPPVDNDLVTLNIHFISNSVQLKYTELALPRIVRHSVKGFRLNEIIQDSADLLKSQVVIRDDIEKKIPVVERVNFQWFLLFPQQFYDHPNKNQISLQGFSMPGQINLSPCSPILSESMKEDRRDSTAECGKKGAHPFSPLGSKGMRQASLRKSLSPDFHL